MGEMTARSGDPGSGYALVLDAAVGKIEKRLMKWQPRGGETEWQVTSPSSPAPMPRWPWR